MNPAELTAISAVLLLVTFAGGWLLGAAHATLQADAKLAQLWERERQALYEVRQGLEWTLNSLKDDLLAFDNARGVVHEEKE